MVEVLEKVEGCGDLSVDGGELNAVFASKTDFLHTVDDAETIQGEPTEWHQ